MVPAGNGREINAPDFDIGFDQYSVVGRDNHVAAR